MTDHELKQEARQVVINTYGRAKQIWPRLNFVFPEIVFKVRGGVAGYARYQKNQVDFNLDYLSRHTEEFLEQTVPHECAHLIARAVYGPWIKPHGKEWKSVMRLLGAKPERCHSYEYIPARKIRQKYLYTCACQEHELGSIQHKRAQSGEQTYSCKFCKQNLIIKNG